MRAKSVNSDPTQINILDQEYAQADPPFKSILQYLAADWVLVYAGICRDSNLGAFLGTFPAFF